MHNDRPLDWIGVVKEVAQLRCVELPTRTAIEHRSATSGVMAAECAQEFNRALAPTNPGPIALAFDPKQGYARRAAIEIRSGDGGVEHVHQSAIFRNLFVVIEHGIRIS